MAYGTGHFGLSPLGIAAAVASTANPGRVSSSRQIDPLTKRFVQGTNGAYAGMPDSVQRVVNLTLLAMAGRSSLIVPDEQRDAEQKIRAALATETDPKDPKIELINVTVSDDGAETELAVIEFRDLATGIVQTVRPRAAP